MGINKDILVGIWRDNNAGAEEYGYSISVKMAASYSMQDLAGTWYVMDIKTPQKDYSYPNHFGFDFGTLILQSDGTGLYTCHTSSDPCEPPEDVSGFSISADGIVTTPLWPNEAENFVMGENKNIMIQIFRDNTPGDEHQVFSVFVKKAE
ncbi:MAG: hypothetical protein A2W23_09150 [Planctomycetes bacterium RBG_16_43_13]|nr:MAG: hypothetical protein A2W23_09150 [Planctomycetes bacterium RBG_16_43_13]